MTGFINLLGRILIFILVIHIVATVIPLKLRKRNEIKRANELGLPISDTPDMLTPFEQTMIAIIPAIIAGSAIIFIVPYIHNMDQIISILINSGINETSAENMIYAFGVIMILGPFIMMFFVESYIKTMKNDKLVEMLGDLVSAVAAEQIIQAHIFGLDDSDSESIEELRRKYVDKEDNKEE